MYILSQFLAAAADACFICSALSKKKSIIITFLLLNDLLFSVHYYILGATTGFVSLLIEGVFMFVALFVKSQRGRVTLALLTIVLLGSTGILLFDGWVSVLPIVYLSVCTLSVAIKNVIFAKVGSIIRNVLCTIYLFLITSYGGAAIEIGLLVFSVCGLCRVIKSRKWA